MLPAKKPKIQSAAKIATTDKRIPRKTKKSKPSEPKFNEKIISVDENLFVEKPKKPKSKKIVKNKIGAVKVTSDDVTKTLVGTVEKTVKFGVDVDGAAYREIEYDDASFDSVLVNTGTQYEDVAAARKKSNGATDREIEYDDASCGHPADDAVKNAKVDAELATLGKAIQVSVPVVNMEE